MPLEKTLTVSFGELDIKIKRIDGGGDVMVIEDQDDHFIRLRVSEVDMLIQKLVEALVAWRKSG